MMKKQFVYINVFVIQILLWLGVQSVPNMVVNDPSKLKEDSDLADGKWYDKIFQLMIGVIILIPWKLSWLNKFHSFRIN